MDDPVIVGGLLSMRDFFKIANADDRRKVIALAAALAREPDAASPPVAPR